MNHSRNGRTDVREPAQGTSETPRPDDPRVIAALEEYASALQAGQAPDRDAFLARHPEIAAALAECLEGLEWMRGAAPGTSVTAPARVPAVAGVAPGTALGDFQVLREIGRGGMGVVYEAEQLSLGRRVALKVLPLAAALDAKQLQRFKNEAHAAAQLHHTNIVPVYGVGCEHGVHYYAMQLIDGQTLAALITELRQQAGLEPGLAEGTPAPQGGPAGLLLAGKGAAPAGSGDPQLTGPYRPEVTRTWAGATPSAPVKGSAGSAERSFNSPVFFRAVAQLGIQAAQALEHAHQLGVIHRDIKPGNLLVETPSPLAPVGRGVGAEGLRLLITDFGLCQSLKQAALTLSGDLLGTLRYMSPEQALARRGGVDHRTDVYSLGLTLYELLTLEPAFPGSNCAELLRQIAREEPVPPRRLNKAIPRELESIVLKAMEKRPRERYASARELADDLERFLNDEPIRAKPPGLVQRARKWERRHRPAVAVASLLLVALGLAAYAFGPAVIRVLTPGGTLVVEVDDPGVKVTVEGDGGIVITGAGPQEVRLRPGSYKVRATRDGKPVRREELITITRGARRVVKVSVEEGAAAARAVANVAPGAFVVLNGEGSQVGKYGTLADAVLRASDGDTIEVRGNGPFVTDPIKITQAALTIRSGAGFRPAIKLRSEAVEAKARLLETTGDLVVEGLEFQRMAHNEQFGFSPWPALLQASKALHVANCRFLTTKTRSAILSDGAVCVVRNCELLCSECGFSVHMSPSTPVKSLVVDNCVATESAQITFWTVGAKESPVRLSRNTWRTEMAPFWFQTWNPDRPDDTVKPPDEGVKVLRVEASANIFDGGSVFDWHCGPNRVFPESVLPKLVSWKGEGNVFAGRGPLIDVQRGKLSPEPAKGTKTLPDWRRFWGTPEVRSIRGVVRYRGGDPLSRVRLAPEQLTPEDFRLRPDSAGYRAGKDGKDLGADVDLVGPGKAYERWKKTPQYRQWLKETGQLRANADQQPLAPGEVRRFVGHTGGINGLAISRDSRRILSGARDKTLRLWDVETGKEIRRFEGHTGAVSCVALSPDGRRALSLSSHQDKSMRLWDVDAGMELPFWPRHGVWGVAFSPDGLRV
jgi:serine/threonine protein kinase